ncbi:MAG: type I methionyl aminopeptidase [Patescibacteria group bacterium]
MVYIKSTEEIRIIREGGKRLSAILSCLAKEVKPGAETAKIEELFDKMVREIGGRPAFKNYPMGGGIFFPSGVCVSINNEVVHGAALPNRIIKEGDIVDLDIGMEWPMTPDLREKFKAPINKHSKGGGFFTDMCTTVPAGRINKDAKKLLQVAEECLYRAIKKVKPGNTINDLARAVQDYAESYGYGVVRDLVGHGVGYFAHEKPDVFNFEINEDAKENIVLEPGMVIAIEPMINLGDYRVKMARNSYTVVTNDHSLSAHFEHTVAVTGHGCEILTR